MNPLEKKIAEKIEREGPVTFETFMDMALYYPELGYYSSPEGIIGRKGDFYTSPHLHPLFGAMLARQLMEMWVSLGRPSLFHAVEMGAGAGYLCKDILDYLGKPSKDPSFSQEKNGFLGSMKYVIVEPFCHFEEKQKMLLGDFAKDIKWIRSLKELAKDGTGRTEPVSGSERCRNKFGMTACGASPGQLTGCVFSNELLDAFPVHLVEMEEELKEIYVDLRGGEFGEIMDCVSSGALTDYHREFSAGLQPGYRTEINLKIKNWLGEVSKVLSKGFILTIDYGYSAGEYYSRERTKGTLLCYRGHQTNEDPYHNIGKQDITAHVNFSSLKKWGEEQGFRTVGYCPQGTFLVASGIDEVIMELYSGKDDYSSETARIRGLIFPQGMGETHSVMVQYKGEDKPALRGFSLRNNVGYL